MNSASFDVIAVAAATAAATLPPTNHFASSIAPPPDPIMDPLEKPRCPPPLSPPTNDNAIVRIDDEDDEVQEVPSSDVLPLVAREKQYSCATSSSFPVREDGYFSTSSRRVRRSSLLNSGDRMLGHLKAREEQEKTTVENPQSVVRVHSRESPSRHGSQ